MLQMEFSCRFVVCVGVGGWVGGCACVCACVCVCVLGNQYKRPSTTKLVPCHHLLQP